MVLPWDSIVMMGLMNAILRPTSKGHPDRKRITLSDFVEFMREGLPANIVRTNIKTSLNRLMLSGYVHHPDLERNTYSVTNLGYATYAWVANSVAGTRKNVTTFSDSKVYLER